MAKPTEKQIAFLHRYEIEPSTTKTSCSKMIGFILHGNFTLGNDLSQRVGILRGMQSRYLGKRVRDEALFQNMGEVRFGRVIVLWPESAREVIAHLEDLGYKPSPFVCTVKWDDGTATAGRTLSGLELVGD